MAFAYLHGFASSPQAKKGLLMKEAFASRGLVLHLPDLNQPSFSNLNCTKALEYLSGFLNNNGNGRKWCLIGSSLGGYMAARYAELNPTRVQKLVLLCPAFDVNSIWTGLCGAEKLALWESEGALSFPDATGVPTLVNWSFLEDARRHPPFPKVLCPTLIIHGTKDNIVPIDSSRKYQRECSEVVQLVEVDDDHSLMSSLPMINTQTEEFFCLSQTTPNL
eukprot:TRINITY_DN873_c0_g1_i2.p1 TRINITY_DN873_c0_g1~~TRINITY_DN873_c0_g1_i2.p1  ORF type:complete len:220 (-),score=11.00 TRINITY_DN873_c0_g1_i2:98-757(-)